MCTTQHKHKHKHRQTTVLNQKPCTKNRRCHPCWANSSFSFSKTIVVSAKLILVCQFFFSLSEQQVCLLREQPGTQSLYGRATGTIIGFSNLFTRNYFPIYFRATLFNGSSFPPNLISSNVWTSSLVRFRLIFPVVPPVLSLFGSSFL
jgi:hypothetical protein